MKKRSSAAARPAIAAGAIAAAVSAGSAALDPRPGRPAQRGGAGFWAALWRLPSGVAKSLAADGGFAQKRTGKRAPNRKARYDSERVFPHTDPAALGGGGSCCAAVSAQRKHFRSLGKDRGRRRGGDRPAGHPACPDRHPHPGSRCLAHRAQVHARGPEPAGIRTSAAATGRQGQPYRHEPAAAGHGGDRGPGLVRRHRSAGRTA